MEGEQKIKVVDLQEMYMNVSMYSRQKKGREDEESEKQSEIKQFPSTIHYEEKATFDYYSYSDIKDTNKEDYMPLKTILSCEGYENRRKLEEVVKNKREIASECIRNASRPILEEKEKEKEPIILVVPGYSIPEACLDVQGCVENNGARVLHVIPRCMAMAFSFYEKDKSAGRRLESRYYVIDIGDGALSINTVWVREQTVILETRNAVESLGYWAIVRNIERKISETFASDGQGPRTDEEHWEIYRIAMKFFKDGENDSGEMVFNGNTKRIDEVKIEYKKNVHDMVKRIQEECKENFPLLLCGYLQTSEFGERVKGELETNGWSRDKLLDGDQTGIEGAGRIFFSDAELLYHSNPLICNDDSCIYALRTSSMRLFPTDQKWKVQSCDRIWGSVIMVGEEDNNIGFIIAKIKKQQPKEGQKQEYEVSREMKIPIIKVDGRKKTSLMLETFVVNKRIVYYHVVDRKTVYTPLKRFDFKYDFEDDDDDGELVFED